MSDNVSETAAPKDFVWGDDNATKELLGIFITNGLTSILPYRIFANDEPSCFKSVSKSNRTLTTAFRITLPALLVVIVILWHIFLGSIPSHYPPTAKLYMHLLEPYILPIANGWKQRIMVVGYTGTIFQEDLLRKRMRCKCKAQFLDIFGRAKTLS